MPSESQIELEEQLLELEDELSELQSELEMIDSEHMYYASDTGDYIYESLYWEDQADFVYCQIAEIEEKIIEIERKLNAEV